MAQEGTLVIADITGYTTYLNESELEHAQDSLASLIELMVNDTRPPLVVSRLEGDAVISYAPKGAILQGQTLIEAIEKTYVDFRQAREQMVLNTTCDCNACRNIPNLDLKFFLHYGTFGVQKIRDHEELVGSDVNLLFRLTKNSITERLGMGAYAALTESTVLGLAFGELAASMQRYSERDEDGKETRLFVHDLAPAWERSRQDSGQAVKPEEAMITMEMDFDLTPAQLWDYLTDPEYRKVIFDSDKQTITEQTGGRTGPGSVYICAHGDDNVLQTIVDWDPFNGFTTEDTTIMKGVTMRASNYLTPTDGGTRLVLACSASKGPAVVSKLHDMMAKVMLRRMVPKGMQALKDKIEADLEAGKVVHPQPADVAASEVRKAARQSLVA